MTYTKKVLLAVVLLFAGNSFVSATEKKPFTVADSISMTRIVDPDVSSRGWLFKFSPDGKRFVMVTKKGNLAKNVNEFSLLLFRTDELFSGGRPEVLVTMVSSSNRDAIAQVKWLADNQTLAFLGEQPGEPRQAYTIHRRTKQLRKLTDHPSGILTFDVTPDANVVLYTVKVPVDEAKIEDKRRRGFTVINEFARDLVSGKWEKGGSIPKFQTFIKNRKSGELTSVQEAPYRGLEYLLEGSPTLWLSPDGRFAVTQRLVAHLPERWGEYTDSIWQMVWQRAQKSKTSMEDITIRRYTLINTETGTIEPLLDAPIGFARAPRVALWAPNSQSVLLSSTFLPLDVTDPAELEIRRSAPALAEFDLRSRKITRISQQSRTADERTVFIRWEGTNTIVLGQGDVHGSQVLPKVRYHKKGAAWVKDEKPGEPSNLNSADGRIAVAFEEDLNSPAEIVATNLDTGKKVVLTDLNPQFRDLSFGKAEVISWKGRKGEEWKGGLVRPPNYVRGTRYPLVIQTHGFSPTRFLVDGSFTTAFAAQALANKGIVVLQIGLRDPDIATKEIVTPKEGPGELAGYQGAIDHLDAMGLIDRERVGLIGFSRTCYHVKYVLTHSSYPFAAATVADGVDFGYMQYMLWFNNPAIGEFEAINGGQPFGDGWNLWRERSPGFNLDKVSTPLRIETIGRGSPLSEWEWYAGLKLMDKPVEMVYLPEGSHVLVKPWERMTSQQGNVDWFTFWLKGEEVPDPAKAEQYVRWRALRQQHEANQQKQASQQEAVP